MKNLKNLLLIALTVFSFTLSSQGLFIKGTFHNPEGRRILASYTLTDSEGEVLIGLGHRLKYKLDLNREYVLHIYNEGYETKVIRFTTHTEDIVDFAFDFEVTLQRVVNEMTASAGSVRGGNVFYDRNIKAFNYRRS